MIGIVYEPCILIIESGGCLFKVNSVLFEIGN